MPPYMCTNCKRALISTANFAVSIHLLHKTGEQPSVHDMICALSSRIAIRWLPACHLTKSFTDKCETGIGSITTGQRSARDDPVIH